MACKSNSLCSILQNLCTDDEYTIENTTYSLDYRPIDGDVSREQNALATANFRPHGKFAVSSICHVKTKTTQTIMSDEPSIRYTETKTTQTIRSD